MRRITFAGLVAGIVLVIPSCGGESGRAGTPEQRAELFDYIIVKTRDREAFSEIKQEAMNFDPIEEMMKYRDEMTGADGDMELFAVLMKISNARRDRHLSVSPVEGGLQVSDTVDQRAPLIFRVDYTHEDGYFFFVADYATDIGDYTGEREPDLGDRLVSVNGMPVDEYFETMRPFTRYSSVRGLWKAMAEDLNARNYNYPATLERETVEYGLESPGGERFTIELPYLEPGSIGWTDTYKEHGENRYSGFTRMMDRETFDVYTSDAHPGVLLIDWYGFREQLVEDMDYLVDYATENDMLGYDIIWDGTRSRGGSKGAYAIQRLFGKPFKTTFGNLKISDITPEFISDREESFGRRQMLDDGVSETEDDGTWLMEWLRTDVTQAIRDSAEYSSNVPFKLAHAPKDSDGILRPAERHFTGKAVCLLGPHGGSHLDQFAAIVIDNDLAYTIGMPTGGYSNTWEWEEVLVFPGTDRPVAGFMWNIGHTIRPNGEVLEGNPAGVHQYIPEGRSNYMEYYDILLREAFDYLNGEI